MKYIERDCIVVVGTGYNGDASSLVWWDGCGQTLESAKAEAAEWCDQTPCGKEHLTLVRCRLKFPAEPETIPAEEIEGEANDA